MWPTAQRTLVSDGGWDGGLHHLIKGAETEELKHLHNFGVAGTNMPADETGRVKKFGRLDRARFVQCSGHSSL
jgi:hypothetical protein